MLFYFPRNRAARIKGVYLERRQDEPAKNCCDWNRFPLYFNSANPETPIGTEFLWASAKPETEVPVQASVRD